MYPTNWQEQLERLRREQNPRRYRQPEQPSLQLPVPEYMPRPPEDDPENEPDPRVIILDL